MKANNRTSPTSHPSGDLTPVSEQTLRLRAAGVAAMRDVLLESGVTEYRLGTGALLGLYRDGDFIPWDWDVGFDICAIQLRTRINQIRDNAASAGFAPNLLKRTALNLKVDFSHPGGYFELLGWRKDSLGRRRRPNMVLPRMIWEPSTEVSIRGVTVTTYADIERYLEHFYGEWRTPIRSRQNDIYMNKNARKKDRLDRILTKILRARTGD